MKNVGQSIRDSVSVPWNSRCTKDPHWLNNIFLFSTEIWAEQLKKTPCILDLFIYIRPIYLHKHPAAWAGEGVPLQQVPVQVINYAPKKGVEEILKTNYFCTQASADWDRGSSGSDGAASEGKPTLIPLAPDKTLRLTSNSESQRPRGAKRRIVTENLTFAAAAQVGNFLPTSPPHCSTLQLVPTALVSPTHPIIKSQSIPSLTSAENSLRWMEHHPCVGPLRIEWFASTLSPQWRSILAQRADWPALWVSLPDSGGPAPPCQPTTALTIILSLSSHTDHLLYSSSKIRMTDRRAKVRKKNQINWEKRESFIILSN